MSGLDGKDRSLPILDQDPPPEVLLPMDRRQALKVMAIAAAAPGLGSCVPREGGERCRRYLLCFESDE